MTFTIGQTFTLTKEVNGVTYVEVAEITKVSAARIIHTWTVNGKLACKRMVRSHAEFTRVWVK